MMGIKERNFALLLHVSLEEVAQQPFLLLIGSGEARAEQKCVPFTDELYGSIFQQAGKF